MTRYKNIETPCVGICSTIYGDEICRGCYRTYTEVIYWNTYNKAEKAGILNRLNALITEVVAEKIIIVDATLLEEKCRAFQVGYREEFSPYTWAHALLREGIDKIKDVLKYGLRVKAPFDTLSVRELITQMDDEIFTRAARLFKNDENRRDSPG